MNAPTFSGTRKSVSRTCVLAVTMAALIAIGGRSVNAAQPGGSPSALSAALGESPVCWLLIDDEEGEVLLRTRLARVGKTSFLMTGMYVFASDGGTYPVTGNIELVKQDVRMNLSTTNFGDFGDTHFVSNLQFDVKLDPATLSGPYEGIGPLSWGGQISTLTVKGTATFQGRCAE